MPKAASARQRRFFGAELARRRAGERTRTDMSEAQLREGARVRVTTRQSRRGKRG